MQVRELQASDALPYRSLMLQAYELAADAFTSTAEERQNEPEAFWIKRIADPKGLSVAFGAFAAEKLIGTVALEFSAKPRTKHKALVIGMYVSPEARGKAVGRRLLEAAVQFAKARPGIFALTLTATEGNAPAISLYRSFGFEVFGIEPMAIHTPEGYKGKVYMRLSTAHGQPAA